MNRFLVKTNHNDFLVNADGVSLNTEQVTDDVGLLRMNDDETTTIVAGFNLQKVEYIQKTNMNGSREYRIEHWNGEVWTVRADTVALYNGCIILGTSLEEGSIQISGLYNGLSCSVIEQEAYVEEEIEWKLYVEEEEEWELYD